MKKLLPALVFLLILGAGGAAVYLFQQQRGRGGSSAPAGAYLPAGTQALLSVPDVNGTLADWQTTDLYKIWAEPEVQAFLARPLSKLPPHQAFDDAVARIVRLSATNVFLALTAIDEKTNQPHFVGGFDFKGDKAGVEELLAGAKDALRRQSPAGKADLAEYQGHALETFDDGNGTVVASTYLEHRYLIANDVALLKATLDRCDGRAPGSGNVDTLDKDANYQAVLARLPPRHATLAFIRPAAGLRRLFDLLAATGQPVDDTRRAELGKLQAVGATTAIENGKLRDTLYYLAPGMNLDLARLRLGSLPLASPATLVYAAATFDWPGQLDLPAGSPAAGTPGSGFLAGLQQLATTLQDHGVTMERFRQAFGNEVSLHLDWPADHAQPALLATVDVRDKPAAGKFVDDLTNSLMTDGGWQISQTNGAAFRMWSTANVSYVTPTLTLTDKHLIFGLDSAEALQAIQREEAGKPNFTGADAYQHALGTVAAPNAAFVYLDSPALFERVYGTFRSVALLGAALLYPQVGDYVDLTKLPNTQTVSKHLSPTVFSQKSDERGSLLESVGSFTLGQAVFVVVGGASAAAIPVMQSQLGAAAMAPDAAPAATPGRAIPSGAAAVSPTPQGH